MKPIFNPIKNYITSTTLRDYYDVIFKLKLLLHYEIYSKITPYVVQNKDNLGKIKGLTEISIINKILITRDINFDDTNEVLDKFRNLDVLRSVNIINSNIILVINDNLNPINIKSEKIKWYTIIERDDLDKHIKWHKTFNFILPSTLYCSMSISKFMSILSDNKTSKKLGESNIKLFLEQELRNGIEINFCFKNEIKEYINKYYYNYKYELETWKKMEYKLSNNIKSNEYIVKENQIHHVFDLNNVLICFKNIFFA